MYIEELPRKPFLARGSNVKRCESCLMDLAGCLCEHRSEIQSEVEFWLLTHPYEIYKPTNTGRLIVDSIAGSRVFQWHRTEPDSEFLRLIRSEEIDPYIVFPEDADYSHRMTSYSAKPGKRSVFIILDGTWRQARRMFRLSEYLQDLPVISLDTPRTSRYKLRKAHHENQLCTVEVAIGLLEQIEDQKAAEHLDGYFEIFNNRYQTIRRVI